MASETVMSLRRASMAIFAAFGFRAAYFLAPVSFDRRRGRIFTNAGFSQEWEELYRAKFFLDDPLPDLVHRLCRPIRWNEAVLPANMSHRDKVYLKRLPDWGMELGVAVPTFGPGSRHGFVGLGHPESAEKFQEVDIRLVQVGAQATYLRYCELLAMEADDEPNLSTRELDVLQGLALGMSKSSLAEQMSVTSSTVDTYVRRLFTKLDAHDRTTAVIRGLSRGLIVAPDAQIDKFIERRNRKLG